MPLRASRLASDRRPPAVAAPCSLAEVRAPDYAALAWDELIAMGLATPEDRALPLLPPPPERLLGMKTLSRSLLVLSAVNLGLLLSLAGQHHPFPSGCPGLSQGRPGIITSPGAALQIPLPPAPAGYRHVEASAAHPLGFAPLDPSGPANPSPDALRQARQSPAPVRPAGKP